MTSNVAPSMQGPTMSLLRPLVTALLCGAASMAAPAQQVELDRSAAVSCLLPAAAARGEPEYPFAELSNQKTGRVKMEAHFTAPDRGPTLTVLESEGSDAFVDAVRDHMRRWRVPCLPQPQGQARLVQEYIFDSQRRQVFWGPLQDRGDAARGALVSCIYHVSGEKTPDYPDAARRLDVQGRVLAHLVFTAPGEPPSARVYHRRSAAHLGRAIETWVEGLRAPCLSGERLSFIQTYQFVFEGQAYGFKPMTLRQLLPAVKDIQKQTLQMDTTMMGCPFDVRFAYRMPALPNVVGSVGDSHPMRRPLLEWLERVELSMPAASLDKAFGDDTTVTVPCLKIDLKP